MTGKNRIMIYGPKNDGTYIVEFRTADLIELNGDDLRQSKQDHHLLAEKADGIEFPTTDGRVHHAMLEC